MPAAREPSPRTHPKRRAVAAIIGTISLVAALLAAILVPHAVFGDEEEAARGEFARLEAFFQEIPEDESESKATRQDEANALIRKHGRIPDGGTHTEINEHIKTCPDCREIRNLATAKGELWDAAWMYRRAAGGLRAHLEKRPSSKTAADARYLLAECLSKLGDEDEALQLWKEVAQAEDEQVAALGAVRLGDHHLEEGEYKEALGLLQAGAENSIDLGERLRLRLEVGRCHSVLGEGGDAKRAFAALAKEIPAATKDQQEEKLRISAMVYLEHPPRRGKDLGPEKAIAWYEEVYGEHRAMQEKIRKAPAADRPPLNAERDALADAIRVNLQDWDEMGHPRLQYTLGVIIADTRNPFGADAAREMIQIGTPEALQPLLRMLQTRQGSYRDKVLDTLVEEGVKIDKSLVEKVFLDRKEQEKIRVAAARYLAHLDTAEAAKMLCGEAVETPTVEPGTLKKGTDPRAKARTLNEGIREALGGMGSTEALDALEEVAKADRSPLPGRRAAIHALGRTGNPAVLEALLQLLDGAGAAVPAAAAEALGRLGDPRGAGALSKRLGQAPEDPELVLALLGGLDRLGPTEKDKETLLALAAEGEHDVRVLAHAVLRQAEGTQGPLLDAVDDKDRHVRWHAIRAAGQSPPSTEVVSALIAWLPQEKTQKLEYQILKYLNRMTDARLGPDAEEWTKWWETAREAYDPSAAVGSARRANVDERKSVSRYFTLEIKSKRVIFLMDVSGSMEAKITVPEGPLSTRRIRDKKINIAKRELIKVLKGFKRDTAYNVLAFADEPTPLFKSLKKATRKSTARAEAVIQGLVAKGGTNIYDTLAGALKDRKVEAIYLLSDGEPSSGSLVKPDEILREIRARNAAGKVQIHSIDLSGRSFFLNRLSKENGGRYVSVFYWQ